MASHGNRRARKETRKSRQNADARRSAARRPTTRPATKADEEEFLELYFRHGCNGVRAYLLLHPDVKYAEAGRMSSEILHRADIVQKIQERLQQAQLSQERVLEEIRRCALQNPLDFGYVDEDSGKYVLDLRGVSREQMSAIAGFDYDKRGRQIAKMVPKDRYVEMAAKFHKLLTDKHELGGLDGQPLVPPALNVKFVKK